MISIGSADPGRSAPVSVSPASTKYQIGLSLFFMVILGSLFYFLLHIPAIYDLEFNPIPEPVLWMIGLWFLLMLGWFLYSVVSVLRGGSNEPERNVNASTTDAKLEQLKAKFASGDIGEIEFERELDALERDGGSADLSWSSDRDTANSSWSTETETTTDSWTSTDGSFTGSWSSDSETVGTTSDSSHSSPSSGFRSETDRNDDVRNTTWSTNEAPEAILRRRFAAGELSEHEFERQLSVLRDSDR